MASFMGTEDIISGTRDHGIPDKSRSVGDADEASRDKNGIYRSSMSKMSITMPSPSATRSTDLPFSAHPSTPVIFMVCNRGKYYTVRDELHELLPDAAVP